MYQRFLNSLAKTPYCSNDKTASKILPRAIAIKHSHIQINHPGLASWLVLDIDTPDASQKNFDRLMWPLPNMIVINPQSGHAHYFYLLATPVCMTENGHDHPKRYLQYVKEGLAALMGADTGYAGLMVKTPFHSAHITIVSRDEAYSLGELAEYIPNAWKQDWRSKGRNVSDLGRNCSLFDALRQWAYQWRNEFTAAGRSEWYAACLAQAERLNHFPGHPQHSLSWNEVKAIAKSVAKWVWTSYACAGSTDPKFKQQQTWRGRQKGKALRDKHLLEAVAMSKQGMSVREIARQLGVSHQTIGNWLKREESGTTKAEMAKSHQISATRKPPHSVTLGSVSIDMPSPPVRAYPRKMKIKGKLPDTDSPLLSQEDQEAMDRAWVIYERNCPGWRAHHKAATGHSPNATAVGYPPNLFAEGGIAAVKLWVRQIEANEQAKRGKCGISTELPL